MKNSNLLLGFGLVLIVVAAALLLLLEDSGRINLIAGALGGLGFISVLLGFLGKKTK